MKCSKTAWRKSSYWLWLQLLVCMNSMNLDVLGKFNSWSVFTVYFSLVMIICIYSFAAVGIGSWGFHMTLLYSMQLMDELPMVFGNTVLIYQLSEIRKSAKRPANWTLIFICTAYFFLFIALYLLLKKPVIHQVCLKGLTSNDILLLIWWQELHSLIISGHVWVWSYRDSFPGFAASQLQSM